MADKTQKLGERENYLIDRVTSAIKVKPDKVRKVFYAEESRYLVPSVLYVQSSKKMDAHNIRFTLPVIPLLYHQEKCCRVL
jgi:hypothetical protein